MNDGRPMGIHFMGTAYPYAISEGYMNFFEGFTPMPVNYAHAGPMPGQDNVYWSMNMNPYKFGFPGPGFSGPGFSGPGSTSYYNTYEVNDNVPRMEVNSGEWEYPTMATEEPATTGSPSRRDGVSSMQTIPEEECSPNHDDSNDSASNQAELQDNVDPDNMTYEELLDLGEAVGTQSRGLPRELIDLLPTSKYKFASLFKRKNFGKRCVICQMTYKRGDQQKKLPCTHVYHSDCITKWLGINKKCPVCNIEVFGGLSSHGM